jgi:hypothetical protein
MDQAEWDAYMARIYTRWEAQDALLAEQWEANPEIHAEDERLNEEAAEEESYQYWKARAAQAQARGRMLHEPPPVRMRTGSLGNRKAIPQAVKVAVAARDGGRCQCRAGTCGHRGICGSTKEPHYDHVIPWSKGGADTVENLQILCGPCNRRKGADNIT